MINIRYGMFETNSSSTDVLCIPKSGSTTLPKEINLSTLRSWRSLENGEPLSVEDKLSFMYYMADEHGSAADFIHWLQSKGINVINDLNEDLYDDYMFGEVITEHELEMFLFNSNSKYFDSSYQASKACTDEEYDKITFRS